MSDWHHVGLLACRRAAVPDALDQPGLRHRERRRRRRGGQRSGGLGLFVGSAAAGGGGAGRQGAYLLSFVVGWLSSPSPVDIFEIPDDLYPRNYTAWCLIVFSSSVYWSVPRLLVVVVHDGRVGTCTLALVWTFFVLFSMLCSGTVALSIFRTARW